MNNAVLTLNNPVRETEQNLSLHQGGIFKRLQEGKAKLAVVGLGYVGLPIALEFANKFSVLGFDINEERVEMMREGNDPSRELSKEAFEDKNIRYTHKIEKLSDANFFVVAVPTPINERNEPELTPLKKATASVAKVLKKGDYVVFESTVYPGCTEEICVPILERISGLKLNEDFKLGYSPERINPGDTVNTVTTITKVVSGSDEESSDEIAKVYASIIKAGVHKASSIMVAEASKIIENTQRDVNIALMNELSLIFDKLGINTNDVLAAAGTKWNFLKFFPGLVGGHCIGVDPYYLAFRAEELKVNPRVILGSRQVNDEMALRVADKVAFRLNDMGKELKNTRILVMGITFKENVSDIRNSKVADLIKKLRLYGADVVVVDPHAEAPEVSSEYGIELAPEIEGTFDAVVSAVAHNEYVDLDASFYNCISEEDTVYFDIRGIMKNKVSEENYMSL